MRSCLIIAILFLLSVANVASQQPTTTVAPAPDQEAISTAEADSKHKFALAFYGVPRVVGLASGRCLFATDCYSFGHRWALNGELLAGYQFNHRPERKYSIGMVYQRLLQSGLKLNSISLRPDISVGNELLHFYFRIDLGVLWINARHSERLEPPAQVSYSIEPQIGLRVYFDDRQRACLTLGPGVHITSLRGTTFDLDEELNGINYAVRRETMLSFCVRGGVEFFF